METSVTEWHYQFNLLFMIFYGDGRKRCMGVFRMLLKSIMVFFFDFYMMHVVIRFVNMPN